MVFSVPISPPATQLLISLIPSIRFMIIITLASFVSSWNANYLSSGHWAMLTVNPILLDRTPTQKCIDIPRNFSLCHGMQYTSMRLPNLLDHDSLDEVIQQSEAWTRLHCDPDARLFLCSVFAPICLAEYIESQIKPCQSLCRKVQKGCEDRMLKYGFPWPQMLNCSNFPVDNNMCIKPPMDATVSRNKTTCKSCSQVATFENILDNFCRSSFVVKARLKVHNESHLLITRKTRLFKERGKMQLMDNDAKGTTPSEDKNKKQLATRREFVRVSDRFEKNCSCQLGNKKEQGNFLIMANEKNSEVIAVLILPWKQDKAFKGAIRKFRKVNCNTLGREIRESVIRKSFKQINPN